jgi:hypothetical protein
LRVPDCGALPPDSFGEWFSHDIISQHPLRFLLNWVHQTRNALNVFKSA